MSTKLPSAECPWGRIPSAAWKLSWSSLRRRLALPSVLPVLTGSCHRVNTLLWLSLAYPTGWQGKGHDFRCALNRKEVIVYLKLGMELEGGNAANGDWGGSVGRVFAIQAQALTFQP